MPKFSLHPINAKITKPAFSLLAIIYLYFKCYFKTLQPGGPTLRDIFKIFFPRIKARLKIADSYIMGKAMVWIYLLLREQRKENPITVTLTAFPLCVLSGVVFWDHVYTHTHLLIMLPEKYQCNLCIYIGYQYYYTCV